MYSNQGYEIENIFPDFGFCFGCRCLFFPIMISVLYTSFEFFRFRLWFSVLILVFF